MDINSRTSTAQTAEVLTLEDDMVAVELCVLVQGALWEWNDIVKSNALVAAIARKALAHLKTEEQAVTEHKAAAQKRPQLTDRELEVLQLFAKGYSYEDVSKALDRSINTVGTHVRHVYRKLEVSSKSEAILEALELGLVPDPSTRR